MAVLLGIATIPEYVAAVTLMLIARFCLQATVPVTAPQTATTTVSAPANGRPHFWTRSVSTERSERAGAAADGSASAPAESRAESGGGPSPRRRPYRGRTRHRACRLNATTAPTERDKPAPTHRHQATTLSEPQADQQTFRDRCTCRPQIEPRLLGPAAHRSVTERSGSPLFRPRTGPGARRRDYCIYAVRRAYVDCDGYPARCCFRLRLSQ